MKVLYALATITHCEMDAPPMRSDAQEDRCMLPQVLEERWTILRDFELQREGKGLCGLVQVQ